MHTLSQTQKVALTKLISDEYPDFVSFENPGLMGTQELEYKNKALKKWRNKIGSKRAKELLTQGKGLEVKDSFKSCLSTNMIAFRSWTQFFSHTDEGCSDLLKAFFEVAEKGSFEATDLQPIFDAYDRQDIKTSWDIISVILWGIRPATFYPIKISYYRSLAKELGFELPKGRPTAIRLNQVLGFCEVFRSLASQWGARDATDIQSVIWGLVDYENDGGDELPEKKRHWVISPGRQAIYWDEFQEKKIAAIGWEDIGDLKQLSDREEIREALSTATGEEHSFMNDSLALWEFSREIKPGDIIYAKQGRARVLGKGVVTSAYQFDESRAEYLHTIGVDWQDVRETELVDGTRVPMKTLTNIDNYRRCRELLESFYEDRIISPTKTYTRADALRDLFMPEEQFDQITNRLKHRKNIILEGPPGVGKTFVAKRLAYYLMGEKNNNRCRMVQFHQSYSYEDFVQGFRPTAEGGFQIERGTFYELCQEATEDADRDYFLVIDEINRGNLSKIFGELMMLIEHDKRGEEFAIQLTYSRGAEDLFHVPNNLHIIGTMNTADRSLSMVDYALRRRFSFFTLEPEFRSDQFKDLLLERNGEPAMVDHLITRLNALNETILADSRDLGRGYRIGHSFFCPSKEQIADANWLDEIIEFEIAPLLREYWVDRPEQADTEIEKLRFK